jgi:hypothetical protein
VPGKTVELRARLGESDPAKPVTAPTQDGGQTGDRLDILNQGRLAAEAHLHRIGGAQPRHAALSFERFEKRRLFPADVRPVAIDEVPARDISQIAAALRLLQRLHQGRLGLAELPANVAVHIPGFEAAGGNCQTLEHEMRPPENHFPVLESAGLALVGVQNDVALGLGLSTDRAPLDVGRETSTTPTGELRSRELGDRPVRPLLGGEAQGLVGLGVGPSQIDREIGTAR